ncbi:MAG: GAF domain-containing protein [candidate division Zixibacteria bacterium]
MDISRQQLIDNIRIAIEEKTDREEVLRTAVEMLDGFSDGYNWTGVYLLEGKKLTVGPYVGPETSHTSIDLNSGICGAAATEKKTIIIDNVNEDPRFLACSITTRSEIVVPLMDGDLCLGEIDIDSDRPSFFGTQDRQMVEAIATTVVQRLKLIE